MNNVAVATAGGAARRMPSVSLLSMPETVRGRAVLIKTGVGPGAVVIVESGTAVWLNRQAIGRVR